MMMKPIAFVVDVKQDATTIPDLGRATIYENLQEKLQGRS